MIKKLRMKFVLINMSIVTFMLCVIMGLVYFFTQENLEEQSVTMMKDVAVRSAKPDLVAEEEEIHLPYLVFKMGNQGETIVIRGGYYDLSNEKVLDDLVHKVNHSKKRVGVLKQYNLRYCMVDSEPGRYLVFADMSSELATLDHLMKTSLVIGMIAFLLFLLISIALSKWVVRPVEETFNKQQKFIADASHELKTPLTVIMTNVQMLLDLPGEKKQNQVFLERTLTMSHKMRDLIEEMLELARTDAFEEKQLFVRLNLSKVVEDAFLPFEAIFFEKGLMAQTQIEPNLFVKGEEEKLGHLVEIFLDNAGKYSKPHGKIVVSLKQVGRHHLLLEVANEGEPIAKENLKRVFERFYREDESRNSKGSYGLGLSIAKGIMDRHHGKLWMESENGMNSCKALFKKDCSCV